LRCDTGKQHHLETSHKEGVTKEEMMEAMRNYNLVVMHHCCSHLRRAYEFWEEENEAIISERSFFFRNQKRITD
jgi:uncharacterized protein YbgA (DUF1722 family)